MVFIKIHKSYRNVVAVCDKDILGKKFSEGKVQLDLRENFYKGDEVSAEQLAILLVRLAREDSSFNIVGKESISIALKAGIITEDDVGKIGGVPFALTLL